jgi:hypothetical protein
VREADNLTTFMCRMSWKSGSLNLLESSGPVTGLLYLLNKTTKRKQSKGSYKTRNRRLESVVTDSLFPMHGIEIKTVTEFFEILKLLCKDLLIFLVILLYKLRVLRGKFKFYEIFEGQNRLYKFWPLKTSGIILYTWMKYNTMSL